MHGSSSTPAAVLVIGDQCRGVLLAGVGAGDPDLDRRHRRRSVLGPARRSAASRELITTSIDRERDVVGLRRPSVRVLADRVPRPRRARSRSRLSTSALVVAARYRWQASLVNLAGTATPDAFAAWGVCQASTSPQDERRVPVRRWPVAGAVDARSSTSRSSTPRSTARRAPAAVRHGPPAATTCSPLLHQHRARGGDRRGLRPARPRRDRVRAAERARVLVHGAARHRSPASARASTRTSPGACSRGSSARSTSATRAPRATARPSRASRATSPGSAGMSKRDQELAHTAGLLHDIGKFALSDRVHGARGRADGGRLARDPAPPEHRRRAAAATSASTARWPRSCAPTTSASTAAATRGAQRRRDPGDRADRRGRRGLRHADRARHLSHADELVRGAQRAAPRRGHASSTRATSRRSPTCWPGQRHRLPPRRRGRLRPRARHRAAHERGGRNRRRDPARIRARAQRVEERVELGAGAEAPLAARACGARRQVAHPSNDAGRARRPSGGGLDAPTARCRQTSGCGTTRKRQPRAAVPKITRRCCGWRDDAKGTWTIFTGRSRQRRPLLGARGKDSITGFGAASDVHLGRPAAASATRPHRGRHARRRRGAYASDLPDATARAHQAAGGAGDDQIIAYYGHGSIALRRRRRHRPGPHQRCLHVAQLRAHQALLRQRHTSPTASASRPASAP